MKLNPTNLAIATAVTVALVWLICSAVVWLLPDLSMMIGGNMMHVDMSSMGWNLTLSGVFIGLLAWSLMAAITAWLLATIYNRLN